MTILYISHLSSNIAAGMSWSVPASVNAQSKMDDVLWVNLSRAHIDHWSKVKAYHNVLDYGSKISLNILPKPFNNPDVVVFEGLYDEKSPMFAKELRRKHIPYIIIPRCALTHIAQNNHAKWKKRVANLLIYNKYINNAASIQYLTKAEHDDSGDLWNSNSFILPNGFDTPALQRKSFNTGKINAVFIGRLDMFQKGLDVLLRSCKSIIEDLRKANFTLCIYGPERYQYAEIEKYIDNNHLNDVLSLGGEVSGEAKKKVLLESDLFVLTSRYEGHPMGLIEALAYGVPAFVTPGSNMSEEVLSADAGWVCAELSENELASQMLAVISERQKLNEKGRNARTLAQKYDWDKLAVEMHAQLEHIVQNNRISK